MLTGLAPTQAGFRFDRFRLDRRGSLWRQLDDGLEEPVVLGSRALDVLKALVEANGELVTRQTLMDAAWPGLSVEGSNLAVLISSLRRLLDEGCLLGHGVHAIHPYIGAANGDDHARQSGA